MDALADRIGEPDLVVCLDSGCPTWDRLWLTTSLRGLIALTLTVRVLEEGVHSGAAGGVVPSTFRIMRELLSRVEDAATGEILVPELHVEMPVDREKELSATSAELGPDISERFPFVAGARATIDEPVAQLIAKVKQRSHVDLLNRRTKFFKGSRVFVRGDRYMQLPKRLELLAIRAFETYARTIRVREKLVRPFDVIDVAFRIAGTGSLGKLRVAVLTRGKGGRDGCWIFDMKEQGVPAPAVLLGKPPMDPAGRVLAGIEACVPRPPRMRGTAKLDGLSMFARRLAPQEDKLDLVRIAPVELGAIAAYLGSLLGRAHRRGAKKIPKKPWSRDEQNTLLDRAVIIAGIHEAAYLAMCKLTS
jgi:hypothetical protein